MEENEKIGAWIGKSNLYNALRRSEIMRLINRHLGSDVTLFFSVALLCYVAWVGLQVVAMAQLPHYYATNTLIHIYTR